MSTENTIYARDELLRRLREIATRPLGTHVDYEPMDMIRDIQRALGVQVYDREPCRCGMRNVEGRRS